MAMVVRTVPRIYIHCASILCVQLLQRILQLLAMPQRGGKIVCLKLVSPAHDIAQEPQYLQHGRCEYVQQALEGQAWGSFFIEGKPL